MIKFKARSSLKQYMPLKLIKKGYKCDSGHVLMVMNRILKIIQESKKSQSVKKKVKKSMSGFKRQ